MVGMTLVSLLLMDRAGRRTLHLWGLGGMFIFSIFITISLLVKVSPLIARTRDFYRLLIKGQSRSLESCLAR